MNRSLRRFGLCLAFVFGCTGSQSDSLPDRAAAPPPATTANSGGADSPSSLLADLDVTRLQDRVRDTAGDLPATSASFEDIAPKLGIVFHYDNGDSPAKLMTQMSGGGVGWFDYDCNGFPDLLLVQGGSPLAANRASNPLDRLFRNSDGARFRDVTTASGLRETGFGQGVAIGDFDNDGFADVYVTNVGLDTFYRNLGDGTFLDQTHAADLINPLWASSAAWGDLDHDGDLDLFVCNYLDYDPDDPIPCFRGDGLPGICHPKDVGPVPNQLFVNRGDGTFETILGSAGLDQPGSKSLGVVIADLNSDQLADVFVANDTTANHLFINRGSLRFRETAVLSGCAASGEGLYQASMGVGFGDYNRDGHYDLYLTHFTSDSNTLYQGLGGGMFGDVTQETALHLPTLPYLGFGTIMADFDCNGFAELFVANGHIDDSFQRLGDQFKMPAQLFAWNGTRWIDQSGQAGPYFKQKLLGRGVASADFDRDGDLDLAVSHQLDSAALLRNDRDQGHWLNLRLIGTASNRVGIGAQARLTQNNVVLHSQLAGGTSYCASNEPLICFGLGESAEDVSIEITWPSGQTSRMESVSVDQELVVREGGAGE